MKNAALQASACTNLGMWPAADSLESLRDFHLLQPAAWERDGTGQGGCPSDAANVSSPTECWGWGFFFLKIRVVESREDFFSPSFCIPTQMGSPTTAASWPGLLSQGALLDAGFGTSLSEMAQQKPTVREYLSFPPFPFLLQ